MLALLVSIPACLAYAVWVSSVARHVDQPYLDEVFHVRQAQHYCNGDLDVWDPKITTPPGLYLVSTALNKIVAFTKCETLDLRLHVTFCMVLLAIVLRQLYHGKSHQAKLNSESEEILDHSVTNMVLFPLFFFFSALYYTDVPSTLSVIVFHYYFTHSHASNHSRWFRTPVLFLLGLVSLMFRQTNIFWVAIFPAAATLVSEIDNGHTVVKQSMYRGSEGFGDNIFSVIKTSWKMQALYDPPVKDALIEDYLKTVISLSVCTLAAAAHPKKIYALIVALAPYVALVATFAAFVLWNGSVVLGDKTNHIATLHLPQMLYIWPYLAFFSWPVIYQHLLLTPVVIARRLPPWRDLDGPMLMFKRKQFLPRLRTVVAATALSVLIVHFNTIVHPFTLADNRHYTFYVFRLLMRPWWVKYTVTPIYVLTGWACIQALGAAPPPEFDTRSVPGSGPDENLKSSNATTKQGGAKPLPLPNGLSGATTTFVLIWLATTSLQLVTAPLVEPRYFILPWLYWRMHLPIWVPLRSPATRDNRPRGVYDRLWNQGDHRLWLESIWSLVINAVTCYIFLNWTFRWIQEPFGTQRFMW